MNTMHVEDFVVLGRTVPEESKKFGKRICMAGYSAMNNQFLRVYPLLVPIGTNADANWFKAKHRYAVDLRRNQDDSRTESWRVVDETKPTLTPWDSAPSASKGEMLNWLDKRAVPSIKSLNDCKLSLGVVKVKAGEWEGLSIPRKQDDHAPEHQSLFEDLEDQAAAMPDNTVDPRKVKFVPYVRFNDEQGSHRLQVREWGAYILLSNPKYADDPEALWKATGYKRDRDTYFVVGNMNNKRTSWLVIKLFQTDAKEEYPLFADTEDEDVT